ncbi:MAG TPA: hypothetical protein ENN30_01655 [Candidatus Woesearchaeota archaeon]|nr:hypothetical protein [Candidatus Woesearchaeota archaeon]
MKLYFSKRKLENLYLKEKLSTVQIAKRLGCGKSTVWVKLKQFGIKTRNRSETSKMIKHPTKFKISKKELIKKYHKEKLSHYQIAKDIECTKPRIHIKKGYIDKRGVITN